MKKRLLYGIATLLLILVFWQIFAMTIIHLRQVSFPTPFLTLSKLFDLLGGFPLSDATLYRHVGDSLLRWGAGFLIAALLGILYGLMAGFWKPMERITLPVINMLQVIPGLAWIPVAILIFSISEAATIFMIAVTAFTPIAISVTTGVKQVDTAYLRAARMLGVQGKDLVFRVLIPGALPHIINSLRVGLGNGWRVLVAGEMVVGSGTGLGYSIIQARWTLDYASAFACILIICCIGLTMERFVFTALEKRTLERWGLSRTV